MARLELSALNANLFYNSLVWGLSGARVRTVSRRTGKSVL